MARGGRSYGGRGRVGRGGGGGGNAAEMMETMMDAVAGHPTPPVVANGVLLLQGNQITVINHLRTLTESPDYVYCQPGQMMADPLNPLNPLNPNMPGQPGQPGQPLEMSMMPMQVFPPAPVAPAANLPPGQLVEIRINVVGSKTESTSNCCYTLTILLGIFLIIPLFFMCCDWWKRIVHPKYVVNLQFYVLLGNFLRKNPTTRMLNLTIGDSAFDREKAQLLCQSLNGSRVDALTFKNSTSPTNYKSSEFDDFQTNVQPIKALPINSSFSWGTKVF